MPKPQIHFVVSAPRSGSTWLARTLNHHPQIFATEQRLFGNFFEVWPNNNGRPAPRITMDAYAKAFSVHYFHEQVSDSREEFVEEFIAEYSAFLVDFAKRKSGKEIIIDKITPYPGSSRMVIKRIKKYFPDSKIIQLIRDGRDVATSGTFDWLQKDAEGTSRYRYFVQCDLSQRLERFFDDAVLTRWAENWKETVQIFRGHHADYRATFESMLDDQQPVIESICKLFQLDHAEDLINSCCSKETFSSVTGRQNGQMDPLSKQRSGISGDWKRFMTRKDGELFNDIAGTQLINENYEKDESWVTQLPHQLELDSSDWTR